MHATAHANVPPVLAQVLNSFKAMPQITRHATQVAYVKALIAQDWEFEHGDHRAYERGRDNLEQLRVAQREVDPDGSIWNFIAPEAYKLPRSSAAGQLLNAVKLFQHAGTEADGDGDVLVKLHQQVDLVAREAVRFAERCGVQS
jgi:hypothetical protein